MKDVTDKHFLNEEGHAHAAGALCANDGTDTCSICGVAMVFCEDCAGCGYHHPTCKNIDENRDPT